MNEFVLDWTHIDPEINWQARAARGANLLDEKRPGWVWDVDLDTLDMYNNGSCVIGQLYGVYWAGYGQLTSGDTPYGIEAQRHGFYIGDDVYERAINQVCEQLECRIVYDGHNEDEGHDTVVYHALTEAWKNEITCRRLTTPEREDC